jgi:hypothetical protein
MERERESKPAGTCCLHSVLGRNESRTACSSIYQFALLSTSHSSQHPTAQSILRPKSDPEYYARIRRAVEKVSKGEKLTMTFAQRMRVFFGGKP